MATSRRERFFEEYTAAWSSPNRVDELVSLFTDDCVYEDTAVGLVMHGKAALQNWLTALFQAFPDFTIELRTHFTAGNWAGLEWLMSGTHTGAWRDMPPTNKRFLVRGATLLELLDGKIRRNSDYWDRIALRKQLGRLPSVLDV